MTLALSSPTLPFLPPETKACIATHLCDWDVLAALSQVSRLWRACVTDSPVLFTTARQLGIKRVELLVGERPLGADPTQYSLFLRMECVIRDIILTRSNITRNDPLPRPLSVTESFLAIYPQAIEGNYVLRLHEPLVNPTTYTYQTYSMDSLLIAGIPLSLKRRPIEQLSLYQACQDSNLYFSSNACYHWLKLITPKDRSDRAPLFQYLSPPQGRFEILRRFYLRMALKGDAPDYLALFLNHGLNFDTLYPQAVYLGLPYLSDEIVHFLQDLIHPNRNWLELVIRKIEDPNKKQEIVTLYLDKGVQPNIYSVLAAWEAAPELIPQLIGSLPPGTRLEWMTFLVRVDPSITTPEKEQAFPSLASILRMDDLTVMELSDPHEDFQSPHYRWLLPFLQHTPHPDSNCLTVAIRRVEDPPLRQAIVTRYLELAVVPNEDSIVAAWANAPDLIPQLVGSLPSDFQLNLSLLMDNGIRQEITPEREEAFSSLFPMLDGMLILLIYPTWWKMAFKAMCEHSFKAISNLFKSIGEFFVALVSE